MSSLNDDLIGYLLDALDVEARQRVEASLRTDADLMKRLESLRFALLPLEADRESPEVPEGLIVRTIARVAEHVVEHEWGGPLPAPGDDTPSEDDWFDPFAAVWNPLPSALPVRPSQSVAPAISAAEAPNGPSGWRRSNVFVAIGLGLLFVGITIPTIRSFQRQAQVQTCQNNLRNLYDAVMGYADAHEGYLPMITREPPYHQARSFVPILAESGHWPGAIEPCPAGIQRASWETKNSTSPLTTLGNAYSYSLGYRDEQGRLRGMRLDPDEPGNLYLPIIADRANSSLADLNPAHGNGQNVLFLGGNVRFTSSQHVGVNGDGIYSNEAGRVEAGLHRWDTVLGTGSDTP